MCIEKVLIIILFNREVIEHFQRLKLKTLYNLMKEKTCNMQIPTYSYKAMIYKRKTFIDIIVQTIIKHTHTYAHTQCVECVTTFPPTPVHMLSCILGLKGCFEFVMFQLCQATDPESLRSAGGRL